MTQVCEESRVSRGVPVINSRAVIMREAARIGLKIVR